MVVRPPVGPGVWLDVNAVPILDDSGQLQQVAVTFIDITDRRQAEQALARAEEESRRVFESSSVATCLVANDGRIIRVNPAICDLLGRSEEELLTMHFLEVTHPDDINLSADLVGDLLAGRRSSLRVTKRYVTGNGRVIWGDVTVSAVRNADGTIRHRIAQILDVTAEHDLRVSLMEAEQIAHLGRWQLDLATGQVVWSPELFALFGLDPTAPVPDFADQERLCTPESWARVSAAIAHTQETGTPYELELELIRPDGSHGWMEARGEAIRDANGTIVELHGVSVDITDRKVAREELQELATHDPLTGLANRAALLDEVTRAVSAGQRSARSTAVLMMDLDRFKAVNDTLGHAAGDDLLVAAAARIEGGRPGRRPRRPARRGRVRGRDARPAGSDRGRARGRTARATPSGPRSRWRSRAVRDRQRGGGDRLRHLGSPATCFARRTPRCTRRRRRAVTACRCSTRTCAPAVADRMSVEAGPAACARARRSSTSGTSLRSTWRPDS